MTNSQDTVTSTNKPYWYLACDFFTTSGYADIEGSYFLHHKGTDTVTIGIAVQSKISAWTDFLHCTKNGKTDIKLIETDVSVFKQMQKYFDNETPGFFLISPDIKRRYFDPTLPLAYFVQPKIEFTFSGDAEVHVSYAENLESELLGESMLRRFDARRGSQQQPGRAEQPPPFSTLVRDWTAIEKDESFLGNISEAIKLIGDDPDGKMTLTRSYKQTVDNISSHFNLYKIHAQENGEYAFSHYICLGGNNFSFGCSPENVFEMRDQVLTIDVVAATCPASNEVEYVERELSKNKKQVREHETSLYSRAGRYEGYCQQGTLEIVKKMQVKRLRNAFHLHSVISGELLPQVTFFDILESVFPLLSARPQELIPFYNHFDIEPHRYYAGIVGHSKMNTSGCFLNLRSALIMKNVIHAKVGVGIIKGSLAREELLETQTKLTGLFEAVYTWRQRLDKL